MARQAGKPRANGVTGGAEDDRDSGDPGGDRPVLSAIAARQDETGGLAGGSEQPAAPASVNEVHLVGRLGATGQERTLPSGDAVLTFHVVVDRAAPGSPRVRRRPGRGRASSPAEGVDALACAAWTARARRTVRALEPGSWIEVEGALRRRFRRGAVPPVSFYEVEVEKVRRVR